MEANELLDLTLKHPPLHTNLLALVHQFHWSVSAHHHLCPLDQSRTVTEILPLLDAEKEALKNALFEKNHEKRFVVCQRKKKRERKSGAVDDTRR